MSRPLQSPQLGQAPFQARSLLLCTLLHQVASCLAGAQQAAAMECAPEPLQGGALPGGGATLKSEAKHGPAGQAQQGASII